MIVYRLESKRSVELNQTFSGVGATHVDGRWHARPRNIIYASQTIELAILEVLVNTQQGILPSRYLIKCDIPDKEIKELKKYPMNWGGFRHLKETKEIGNKWYDKNESLALKVRSSIVPESFNILINAKHPAFVNLRPSKPKLYKIDQRLI